MTTHTLRTRIILPALTLIVALPVVAWHARPELLALQPESKLWVDGKSTIKSFSCTAGDVGAVVDAVPNGVSKVAAGEKGIRALRITVPADKLECGNGTMNEHMRKAIKLNDNPIIEFTMSGYDVSKGADGVSGTLTGTLKLGGVTKSISIPAAAKADGGALHVTGAYELKMSDFDLTPPSLMFGRIKVRDDLTVKFDVLLKS
ncbi:MAG: YceI family protein [Gemmatimonadota bacterium]|nr:YceI family protein [Gemmatimonadota bacterium]